MAESPVILLSGNCPRAQIGRGAFQEMDQVAIVHPVCKAAWMVEDAGHLETAIDRAFAIATSGRPGPVFLSLPTDAVEATPSKRPKNIPQKILPPTLTRMSHYRAKATSCNSRSDGFQGQSSLRNAWSVAQCLSQDLTLFSQEPIARLSF